MARSLRRGAPRLGSVAASRGRGMVCIGCLAALGLLLRPRNDDRSARIGLCGGPGGPSRPNLAICFALRRGAPSSADRRSRSGTMTHSMGRRPISRRRTSCGADS